MRTSKRGNFRDYTRAGAPAAGGLNPHMVTGPRRETGVPAPRLRRAECSRPGSLAACVTGLVLLLVATVSPTAAAAPRSAGERRFAASADGRFSVGAAFSNGKRDIKEYDDSIALPAIDNTGSVDIKRFLLEGRAAVDDYVDVALRAGLSSMVTSGFQSAHLHHDYGAGLLWGVGARMRIDVLEAYGIPLDASFDYNSMRPDKTTPAGLHGAFKPNVTEWRLRIGSHYTWDALEMRGGLHYSDFTLNYEHPLGEVEGYGDGTRKGGFEATQHLGLDLGADYAFSSQIRAGVEFTFPDETGFGIHAAYSF